MPPLISKPQLAFEPFTERYLELSWNWLQDPEIRALTLTPSFSREQQLDWFRRLPEMRDYQIWGVAKDGNPIGALGLKHIRDHDAEYWGYIGERACWNLGLGKDMLHFAVDQARLRGLRELYLRVGTENQRAIRLYSGFGFKREHETAGLWIMRLSVSQI